MPFPFHRLHVDLQKRLRALTTPNQLYHLQLAIGDAQNYLNPIQTCYDGDPHNDNVYEETRFRQTPSGYELRNDGDVDYSEDGKLAVVTHLTVDCAISEAAFNVLRAHSILNVWYLGIHHQDITAVMMFRLASACSKTCTVIIFETMELLPEISFQLIFYLFPIVDDLCIYVEGREDWLDDLLESKKTRLERLRIILDMPVDADDLAYIDSESLYKFCQTQDPDFTLELDFVTDHDQAEPPPETWDFLNSHFRVTEDATDQCKIALSYRYGGPKTMPFPFYRLHCGLQTRLRTLATPSQVYHLQIAVGDFPHCLYPVQLLEETDCCTLSDTMDEWELTDSANNDYSEGSKLVLVNQLEIDYDTCSVTEDGINCLRTHGVLDIKKLDINSEEFDALTLLRLASVCSKTCTTLHFGCTELRPEISFELIFYLFPIVDDLFIYVKGKKHWIYDLLKSKKTGMKHLKIVLNTPDHDDDADSDDDEDDDDDMDNDEDDFVGFSYIQPKSVFEFCKTQPPDFKLEFYFMDPYEDPPTPETWDFLKPYFRVTDDEKDCKIMMTTFPDVVYMYACYA